MNKTPRLSKSGIEYLDYAWNFASGCENWKNGVCPVENCWAKGITERFAKNYPNGFEPTFYPEAFLSPLHLKKPSIIGCAFMGDLFGSWFNPEQIVVIPFEGYLSRFGSMLLHGQLRQVLFGVIRACPQHTFVFLTKNADQLIKWSPFPDNCWVGVTATNPDMFRIGITYLAEVKAGKKYVSLEPLLDWGDFYGIALEGWLCLLDQVIIGSQTKPYKPPEISWVEEIALACTKAHIPLFLKDNLKSLLPNRMPFWGGVHWTEMDKGVPIRMSENRYRQEMPTTNV